LFGDRVVGAENNHKVSINKTKLLLHVIIVKPTESQGESPGIKVDLKHL